MGTNLKQRRVTRRYQQAGAVKGSASPVKRGHRKEPLHHLVAKAKLREAGKNWDSLSPEAKEQLLEELVCTRIDELRQSFPDLVAIGFGLRTKKAGRRRRRFHDELVVKFMVANKWSKKSRLRNTQRALPKFFLAYATRDATRVLCRVPTDIEDRRAYRNCVCQSAPTLVAVGPANSGGPAERGSIACVVQIPGDTENVYAVSAAHLFDLTEQYWPALPSDVLVKNATSSAAVAIVSDFVGPLRPLEQGFSFDAALATVTDRAALADVLGDVLPANSAKSSGDIPATFNVSTARGMISARKAATWLAPDQVLQYVVADGSTIRVQHAILVESAADTIPGDSGSPVISQDGLTLLGMNIWGGDGISFMIPAYSLLASENYAGLPAGQVLSLVKSGDLQES